jgi:hypothetical protein
MYDKNTNTWTMWDLSNGITGQPHCMTAHAGGKMYLGHYGGYDLYDNGVWTSVNLMSIGISSVYEIEFDDSNNMWLGTPEGLWRYDGTSWTNWNESNSNIAADFVSSIEIDQTRNIIYVAAFNVQNWPYYGGLSYFNGSGNSFTTFLEGSSPISHKQVEDLALDTLGNIWILTQSEGVSVHNPNGLLGFECIDKRIQTGTTNISSVSVNADSYVLSQNYPNPFNPVTKIDYKIAQPDFVSLKIFDLLGKEVAALVSKRQNAGSYSVEWNASHYPSGVYFYKLKTGSFSEVKRMMLIK